MDRSKSSRSACTERFVADCSECSTALRCWGGTVPPEAGFRIRSCVAGNKGEVLFSQGEIFAAVYLVRSGCLKLAASRIDGSDQVIGFRVAGEIIGLEGLASGRYPHRVEALTPVSLCRLQWTVAGDGSRHPVLLQRVLVKAIQQWQAAERPWAGLGAAGQVAAFLDDFAARMGETPATFPMTRAEIGSYLGLAEETVVRAIRRQPKKASGSQP